MGDNLMNNLEAAQAVGKMMMEDAGKIAKKLDDELPCVYKKVVDDGVFEVTIRRYKED